jgi:hypothetical protein
MRSNSLPSMSRNVSHRAPFWQISLTFTAPNASSRAVSASRRLGVSASRRLGVSASRRLGVEIAGNQVEVKAVFAGFRPRSRRVRGAGYDALVLAGGVAWAPRPIILAATSRPAGRRRCSGGYVERIVRRFPARHAPLDRHAPESWQSLRAIALSRRARTPCSD